MLEKIQETAAYLKGKMHTSPETAIILGTGLGSLANEITEKYEIKYSDIPNFPVSTVEGHSGKLIFGKLGNKDIMAMQGRFHYYEGYSMKEVTFPVRVMRELGIKRLTRLPKKKELKYNTECILVRKVLLSKLLPNINYSISLVLMQLVCLPFRKLS